MSIRRCVVMLALSGAYADAFASGSPVVVVQASAALIELVAAMLYLLMHKAAWRRKMRATLPLIAAVALLFATGLLPYERNAWWLDPLLWLAIPAAFAATWTMLRASTARPTDAA